ncbi:MAG: 23S rRNA (pseudouridine(1915)-N(3))-methyltransferase RlmH [Bacilli bacterium]|nr:23S rRNA (pseudouridine(1915)-N(3))-methyltransferase RlmH [Bacilli bacterium]
MIKIVCVGKIKEKYLQDAIAEYQKRITKYDNIKIIEIKDTTTDDINKNLLTEEKEIRKHLNNNEYIIVLDIDGKELSSEELAAKLEKTYLESSNITFIIGGSYGLSKGIKSEANYHLSFSKMTFPHQLFRVILLEQIYRSFKIINNETYHK